MSSQTSYSSQALPRRTNDDGHWKTTTRVPSAAAISRVCSHAFHTSAVGLNPPTLPTAKTVCKLCEQITARAPGFAFRVSMHAAGECLRDLKRRGSQRSWLARMQTRSELYELLGYDPIRDDLP